MKEKGLIILSLFDGISCGQLALQRAGVKVEKYYASEIDRNAIRITQKNFPETIQLGDITRWKEWNIEKPDLIMGGSPCQGFSFIGKQANFNDPRSKLFFEFAEILKFYSPSFFLLENVKMKKEYQDVITNIMGLDPILINSKTVSAQNRERLYWTNIPNVTSPKDKEILLKDIIESGYTDREKSLCILESYSRPSTDPEILYRRYKEKSFMQIVFFGKDLNPKAVRILTQQELEKLQTLPVGYTQPLKRDTAAGLIGNAWTVEVVAHILKGLKR